MVTYKWYTTDWEKFSALTLRPEPPPSLQIKKHIFPKKLVPPLNKENFQKFGSLPQPDWK